MIALDKTLPAESSLPRIAETFRLQRRRLEMLGALDQLAKGYPPTIQVGGVHARLSDHGREEITAAIHADMIEHLREIESELRERGAPLESWGQS